jgi:hypothetical protein
MIAIMLFFFCVRCTLCCHHGLPTCLDNTHFVSNCRSFWQIRFILQMHNKKIWTLKCQNDLQFGQRSRH